MATQNYVAKAVDFVRTISGVPDMDVKAVPVNAKNSQYMVRIAPKDPEQFKSAKIDQIFDSLQANLPRAKLEEVETEYGMAYVFKLGRKREVRLAVNADGKKERLRSIVVRQYN